MQLGDARSGKLADNLTGFGRTLRRAGIAVDSARMAANPPTPNGDIVPAARP